MLGFGNEESSISTTKGSDPGRHPHTANLGTQISTAPTPSTRNKNKTLQVRLAASGRSAHNGPASRHRELAGTATPRPRQRGSSGPTAHEQERTRIWEQTRRWHRQHA
ncbi:uncharacterized protein LOC144226118 isoform X2 [Crocuta crocuta]